MTSPAVSTVSTVAQLLAGGGVCTFFGALVQAWVTRRKRGVETDQLLSVAAINMLKPAREQIEYLRKDLVSALEEIHVLRGRVTALTGELETTRHELNTMRTQMHPRVQEA